MLVKGFKGPGILLIVLFMFFFGSFLFAVAGIFSKIGIDTEQAAKRFPEDQFDSSLAHLNSVRKLMDYCDSFTTAVPGRTYPEIVSETLRKRFYHGYSFYTIYTNAVGVFLKPILGIGATAIVIPDDIAKHPMAACSQQSILGMEIFKRKGYPVRKVTMFDTVSNTGHFAFEAFYEKGWHFFDTDQEPDSKVLDHYNRPSAAFLAANPEIILEAYHARRDPQLFKRLLASYKIGAANKFAAPNAYLYQFATKVLTWSGWLLTLLIMAIGYKWNKAGKKQSRLTTKKKHRTGSVLS